MRVFLGIITKMFLAGTQAFVECICGAVGTVLSGTIMMIMIMMIMIIIIMIIISIMMMMMMMMIVSF